MLSAEREHNDVLIEQKSKNRVSPHIPDKSSNQETSQMHGQTSTIIKVPPNVTKVEEQARRNTESKDVLSELPKKNKNIETGNFEPSLLPLAPPGQRPLIDKGTQNRGKLDLNKYDKGQPGRIGRTEETKELEEQSGDGNKGKDVFKEMLGSLEENIVDKARELKETGRRFLTNAKRMFDVSKSIERLQPKARSIYDKFSQGSYK